MLSALDLAPSDIIPGYELWLAPGTVADESAMAEQYQHDREPRTIDAPPIESDIPAPAQQPET
ncbi:hypothetical protein JQK88_15780 [Mesorhizobium caraganae]|uniref:hypothetical protein n=1 Tax=Mesorhizobium caraganae TaxID=483206 RepID=UPI00177F5769|nr:hypothetical protein [Mesorhizobium caraganae]MBM2712689.1 hypothetical protein [Mesorhizobium caraganae]